MNTIKQLIAICDERLKVMGITRNELLKRAGLSETVFTMALSRNTYLRVETLAVISELLEIPLVDLLGINDAKKALPEDIEVMENMLLKIPEKARKMILMNIKNYYEVALSEKKKK